MPDNRFGNNGKGPGRRSFYDGRPGAKRPLKGENYGEDRPPKRDGGFGDRPPRRDSFGGKPNSFGDRPPRRDSFGGKPNSFGDRPPRRDSFGGKPNSFGDRPPRRDNDFGDRPPKRDFGAPPRYSNKPARPVPPAVHDAPRPMTPPHPVMPPMPPVPPVPPMPPVPPEMPENLLVGRNPIREAIKSGRPVEKLLVADGDLSGSAREIVAWAREAGVIVQYVDRRRLDAIYPNHQGMLAYVAAAEYSTVEAMLEKAREKGEEPFIIVCDGITDPHNLGAIIRTAECCGAHGVVIPERRSAGLNPAAVKASAGAVEYLPVAKVVNLSRTLDELKEQGMWVIGAALGGEEIEKASLTGPVALVIGSEGDGISQLVKKQCDILVKLPMLGHIESLNASVAAGMVMYDIMRARLDSHA